MLVSGPEELLAERAVSASLTALREQDPQLEVIRIEPERYTAGDLAVHGQPSLFGGAKALVVTGLERAGDDLVADVLGYVAAPAPEVTLIAWHAGGARARKAVEAFKAAKARVLPATAVKTDRDKHDFTVQEFRRAGRKVTPDAVQALQEAVGRDLRELAAACQQLIVDCQGTIDEQTVARYHGGKVEATGFRVADAALAGDVGQALRLLRHALAAGVDPVPIIAVLAGQLRQLVKVAYAGRGPSGQVAAQLSMAPWQVDKARRMLRGWDPEGLGRAIQVVAAADQEVKGGGRDPQYALERAVVQIVAALEAGAARC